MRSQKKTLSMLNETSKSFSHNLPLSFTRKAKDIKSVPVITSLSSLEEKQTSQ